jgi:branched-chain amino acid transport system ATP-binding protein
MNLTLPVVEPAAAPLLEVADLQVAYGRVEAVRGVSLSVARGELVAVIGSNGAGKSSIMKAIAGVVRPVGGRIAFAGRDVTGRSSHEMVAAGLAMVPEGRRVFGDQTVEDNLRLGSYSRRLTAAATRQRLEEAYTMFPRLAERRAQLAGSLSGGEQQMLAIARGLQSKPDLLVIDELSLGLAPKILDMLFPVLVGLNRDGLSILLVEQLAAQALRVASRAYVVETGRILLSGPAHALAEDGRVIDAYLGRRAAAP